MTKAERHERAVSWQKKALKLGKSRTFTLEEAAEHLDVAPSVLYRLLRKHELKCEKKQERGNALIVTRGLVASLAKAEISANSPREN